MSKPTPTPAEIAAYARGEEVNPEWDGSDPDPTAHPPDQRDGVMKLHAERLAARAAKAEVEPPHVPPPAQAPPKEMPKEKAVEAEHSRSTYKTRAVRGTRHSDEDQDD